MEKGHGDGSRWYVLVHTVYDSDLNWVSSRPFYAVSKIFGYDSVLRAAGTIVYPTAKYTCSCDFRVL